MQAFLLLPNLDRPQTGGGRGEYNGGIRGFAKFTRVDWPKRTGPVFGSSNWQTRLRDLRPSRARRIDHNASVIVQVSFRVPFIDAGLREAFNKWVRVKIKAPCSHPDFHVDTYLWPPKCTTTNLCMPFFRGTPPTVGFPGGFIHQSHRSQGGLQKDGPAFQPVS